MTTTALRAAELAESERRMVEVKARRIVDLASDDAIAHSEQWPVIEVERVCGCSREVARRVCGLLRERRDLLRSASR